MRSELPRAYSPKVDIANRLSASTTKHAFSLLGANESSSDFSEDGETFVQSDVIAMVDRRCPPPRSKAKRSESETKETGGETGSPTLPRQRMKGHNPLVSLYSNSSLSRPICHSHQHSSLHAPTRVIFLLESNKQVNEYEPSIINIIINYYPIVVKKYHAKYTHSHPIICRGGER